MAKNNPINGKIELEKHITVRTIIVALITGILTSAIPAYYAERQRGKENVAVKSNESESKPASQDEIRNKENQIINKQNQIQSLQRTIDFLMGKTGMLNQKIDEYEKQLKIPQTGRIVLFEHINYKGHRSYLKPGDDVSDLSLYGFGNTVSSIKVEGALRARAYSEVNYAGFPFLLVESDMPSLVDYHWNDRILSISVETK